MAGLRSTVRAHDPRLVVRNEIDEADRDELTVVGRFADLAHHACVGQDLQTGQDLLLAGTHSCPDRGSGQDWLRREQCDELRRGRVGARSAGHVQPGTLQFADTFGQSDGMPGRRQTGAGK